MYTSSRERAKRKFQNENQSGHAKMQKGKTMKVTYGVLENYRINRIVQTNENILKAYYKASAIISALSDDIADAVIEAIGNLVWGDASIEDKALIKSVGLTYKNAEIWYWHDIEN